jgi:hypothetical protein
VLAAQPRVETVFLPPASPDLNPQEHVWLSARAQVSHNHTLPDLPPCTMRSCSISTAPVFILPGFTSTRHLFYYDKSKSILHYYYHFDKFLTFARQHLTGEALKAVERFKRKRAELRQGLLHPGCHRVSTMLERHM